MQVKISQVVDLPQFLKTMDCSASTILTALAESLEGEQLYRSSNAQAEAIRRAAREVTAMEESEDYEPVDVSVLEELK